MIKIIRVDMPDGSKWDVPAAHVAHDRAIWYVSQYGNDYDEVYNETLADDDEILDWAANNMNWEDVQDFARLAQPAPHTDYQEGWVNGNKQIVQEAFPEVAAHGGD